MHAFVHGVGRGPLGPALEWHRHSPGCRETRAGAAIKTTGTIQPTWRRSSRGRLRAGALLAALPLLLSACGGAAGSKPVSAAASAAPPAMTIALTPKSGTQNVEPDDEIVVSATHGRLTDVQVVNAAGEPIAGRYDVAGLVWAAHQKLSLSETYTMQATGVDEQGTTVRESSQFSTLDIPESKRLFASEVAPLDGGTVGIAQPVVVGFNRSVVDKKAVQAALTIETSKPVEGAWYWIDDQYVDWRPKEFWPENTHVKLGVAIEGLKGGPGLWGGGNRSIEFDIGRAQIIKVDVTNHKLKVVNGKGKTLKSFPVSTGKSGWETRNGTKVVMEKVLDKKWTNEAIQAPEHYRLQSSYAMRMTNSGEFIHDAPWNTGNIGSANTSHGCVGMTVTNMRWLYNHTITGDAIVVTGSPKPYTNLFNRYADWNIPWSKWSKGNATYGYL
jgi:lipoprotein-anchoring transpeptidase ErfK/SrfK